MHRWRGIAPDMSSQHWHPFGSDARVYLRPEQRAHGDKMSARCAGGNGRLRYFGPDCMNCQGTTSKGAIIYDLKRNRISIERNVKYDHRLRLLRINQDKVSVEANDSDSDESEDEAPETDPESDDWSRLYTTERDGETFKSVARLHGVDTAELLQHNMHKGKVPGALDQMTKGTGVWLPNLSTIAEAPSPPPTADQVLAGRIFKRYVPGHGEHYGAVVTGKDSKGRYRVVYDDLDGIYPAKPIFLSRSQIIKGILPSGIGKIHIEEALSEFARSLAEESKRTEEANAAYRAHAAYETVEQRAGRSPDTRRLYDLISGAGQAGVFDLIASSALEELQQDLTLINSLAAGAVACSAQAKPDLSAAAANEAFAHKLFNKSMDRWCEKVTTDLAQHAREVRDSVSDSHAFNVKGLEHIRASEMPTPKNFAEAMKGEFANYWKDAIQVEMDNLKQHGTYEWVPPPAQKVYLDSTWVFKAKSNNDGSISRLKARLVARGFRQIYGHDYTASMAPVGKLVTFRWLLAEMARRGRAMTVVDVKSAYLQAKLKIPQYMKPPKGVSPPEEGWVMKVVKSLYGLRNAGREWHDLFRKDLLEWGFEQGNADPCLFTKRRKNGSFLRILLFVDDMAVFHDPETDMLSEFTKQVESKYEYSDNENNVYLGMTVTQVGPNSYHLGQQRYILDVLRKYDMEDCKSVFTPWSGDPVSKLDCPQVAPGKNPLQRKYAELIGILRWIERCTRPDLTVALSELGKVQANPGELHWKKLLHLLRYVASTRDLGLLYGAPTSSDASGPLVGYVDSNWGGVGEEPGKSRGGYIFMAWQTPISWSSFKGTAVALSSCEAEYMAASIATQEALWLRYLASDMGYGDLRLREFGSLCEKDYKKACLSKWFYSDEMPLTLFNDNKSCIHLSKDPLYHKRSRHIHIRYSFVRDQTRAGHVDMAFIPTKDNLADLMTKHLPKTTHDYLTTKLLYRLKGSDAFSFNGKHHVTDFPKPVRDKLTPPDLSRYRYLRPMSLSFCDTEEEMQRLRDCAPAVYPPDHDEVAASHEASQGSPGCPCAVCAKRRLALFNLVRPSPSRTSTKIKDANLIRPLFSQASSKMFDRGRAGSVLALTAALRALSPSVGA